MKEERETTRQEGIMRQSDEREGQKEGEGKKRGGKRRRRQK